MIDTDYCEVVDDPAEFYVARMVRARKPHVCYECGGPIVVGEVHEYAGGRLDGWWSARTCAACCRGPLAFVDRNCGGGRYHGNLIGHLQDVVADGGLRSVFAEGLVIRWIDEALSRRLAPGAEVAA